MKIAQKQKIASLQPVKALAAEGIPSPTGLRMLSESAMFMKLNKKNRARSRLAGREGAKRGLQPGKIPAAKWANKNMIKVSLSQHTGESEITDFSQALNKISG